MPERDNDPIANTQMFRAFVQRGEEPEPATKRAPVALIITIAAVVVVVAAVVIWLLAS
ncbi:MAG: hypothetical protein V7637_5260 [Mycobacteriales bacterium]|jgi:hypothetical protein